MNDASEPKPISLLRWVLFGWVYWLQSRPGNPFWMKALGVVNILVAGPFLMLFLMSLPARLAGFEHPVAILSMDAECNKMTKGGTYFIEVGARRYECTGSDTWCPDFIPVQVVYDRDNPSHCRAATAVARLSRWEISALLRFLIQFCGGASFALIREDDPYKASNVVGHGLLLTCAVLVAIVLITGLNGLS